MSFWSGLRDSVPLLGPLVGGAVDFFGQRNANSANRQIASQTNENNLNIARAQMDFQERMANTSYQRGTKDMIAAGINPILAYAQGGASSPSGASISSVTGAPMHNTLGHAREAITSAINQRLTNAQLDNVKAQTMATKAQTVKTLTDAQNSKLMQPGLRAEARLDDTSFGTFMRGIGRVLPSIASAVGVKRAFVHPR